MLVHTSLAYDPNNKEQASIRKRMELPHPCCGSPLATSSPLSSPSSLTQWAQLAAKSTLALAHSRALDFLRSGIRI